MLSHSQDFIGQALGTCTLKHLLGRGGMGAVYLAQQSRPRRTVAVKVLLPNLVEDHPREEFLARFRREADAIAALDHINIMPIYEYGEQGETAYLVMPYVTGGTLRDRLAKRPIPPLEETLQIIEEAAAGLDAAHAQGIVHRDLKPGNILFHADGRVVLADFGLAKVLKEFTEDSGVSVVTSTGTIVGTPEYLSPEQGSGEALDNRTDVYSLGVVLYQMLAGRVPFVGPSPVAVAINHTLEPPPPLARFNSQVPRSVEAVVMKALSKKPDERFASAGEMARALRLAASPEQATRMWQTHSTRRLPHASRDLKPDASTTDLTPAQENEANKVDLGVEEAQKQNQHQHQETPEAVELETPNALSFKEQVTALPTMLMHTETEGPHAALMEETPHLPPREDPLPGLPTLITQADPTVTDPHSPQNFFDAVEQRLSASAPLQQSPMRSRSPEPVMEKRVLTDQKPPVAPPVQQPQKQVQAGPYTPQRHAPHLPEPAGNKQPSLRVVLTGCLLALVVVVGSIVAFTQIHPTGNLTGKGTPTATQQARATTTVTAGGGNAATATAGGNAAITPQGTTTPPGNLSTLLPTGVSHGQMTYWSTYPSCNSQEGSWSTPANVITKCTNDGLQMSNSSENYAGLFLNTPPQGQSIPPDFVLQVQVTINPGSSGGFGIFYRSQPNDHQQAYAFMIENKTWTAYSYNTNTNQYECLNCTPVNIIPSLSGTFTVIIIANSSTFRFYVNGEPFDPGAESGGQYPSGTIGFAVDPGANVTFKNLAIYEAA